jgi:putative transposase
VLTEAGPVGISVPRDRDASFEPKIVAKRQRRSSARSTPNTSQMVPI